MWGLLGIMGLAESLFILFEYAYVIYKGSRVGEENSGGKYYPWEPVPDEVTQGYIDRAREALDNLEYQEALDLCEEAKAKGIEHPRLISCEASALIWL